MQCSAAPLRGAKGPRSFVRRRRGIPPLQMLPTASVQGPAIRRETQAKPVGFAPPDFRRCAREAHVTSDLPQLPRLGAAGNTRPACVSTDDGVGSGRQMYYHHHQPI